MPESISPSIYAAALAAILLGCAAPEDVTSPATAAVSHLSTQAAFRTAEPAQAFAASPGVQLTPLVTVGDLLPGGAIWAPIPDGLGAYKSGDDLVLFSNHELTSSGVKDGNGTAQYAYARVSRLTFDLKTLTVKDATYVVTGSEQYQRLCSATWAEAAQGLPSGWFFSGEEMTGAIHDGIQLAVSPTGTVKELPWIGRFNHENLIAVPYPGKVVLFGFDDTAGQSELYMYVGESEDDVLNGTGRLYAFKSSAAPNSGSLQRGVPITGEFVEVANSANLSSTELQSAVTGLGAFPFVRLEDGDYDHRPGGRDKLPAIYFVDTGSQSVLCNGSPCDPFGSIYRLTLDRHDPTTGAKLTLLRRSEGADRGFSSPDNIAAGERSLMVQEDPANNTFAGQRAPRIYNFAFGPAGELRSGKAVVELDNPTCNEPTGNCWESSGIIDASRWLGPGNWLFDVQAHTLPVPSQNLVNEGGQLLLLHAAGS